MTAGANGTEASHAAAAADADAEREHVEQLARAHAALAAAQDRSYWLDRWGIDLNELMRKPAGARVRVAMRVARRGKRAAIEVKRHLAREAREAQEEIAGAADLPADDPLERTVRPAAPATAPVTDALFDRLGDDGAAAIDAALSDAERTALLDAPEPQRRRLLLGYGVERRVAAVLDRTGLSALEPPPDGPAEPPDAPAVAASASRADLVADALEGSGGEIAAGMRGLDIGCGTGEVLRLLAAAHAETAWQGCDPNAEAVEWAAASLPGIDFAVSGLRPPLPYADETLDFAYALSLWTHCAAAAAVDWLADVRRAVRPGGRLVLAAHGYQTIAHDHAHGVRTAEQLGEIRDALYASGHWFKGEFGRQGDDGIDEASWGTAFLAPEWLLSHAPGWRVDRFWPGRAEGGRDVYVLERR
ncbi:MAG: class I SAM-dependent methyltransferase [Solirubrobacterales bacterium]|nr:class I SAM-dependent methyltransferase [Solirubrobacterales bacterium]